MILAPTLAALPGIRHAFFTREGGVSDGIYAGLNCGFGSGDDAAKVLRNRTLAMARLGLPADALATLHQVHSPTVVEATGAWARGQSPRADAVVTTTPGVAAGVLTADCTPVLFADAAAGIVGAAHAGWRGALDGVLAATVAAMVARGAVRSRIVAAVGPCIGQPSYEVGAEFRDRFLAADPGFDRFFVPGARAGKFQFDLPGFVAMRLEEAGVGAVDHCAADTVPDPARFFSYRRATLRGEGDYGRTLSAIALAG
ncbi:peptidoglycan editing factor PgeF [Stella sp.]|uniref:peptidoglycan editing factor PgeF n=1 Tax=Stella sp. TaxID=2912054 RepID=UPI0035B4C073